MESKNTGVSGAAASSDVIKRARSLLGDALPDVERLLVQLPDLQPEALRETVIRIVGAPGKRVRPIMVLLVRNVV